MRALGLRVLIGLAVLLVSCGYESGTERPEPVREGYPGKEPVARVVDHLDYGRIVFYPEPAAQWTELIDLRIFEGFWPNMTGEDAERALGPADEYREQDPSERFWTYRRPGGRVIVAHKSVSSLFGGWRWRLEAELEPPRPPAELLHPRIVEELPDESDHRYSVTIMNNDTDDRSPAARAYVEDGQIVRLDISPQGAKGPPLGSRPGFKR